jgi:hypothetical protein
MERARESASEQESKRERETERQRDCDAVGVRACGSKCPSEEVAENIHGWIHGGGEDRNGYFNRFNEFQV